MWKQLWNTQCKISWMGFNALCALYSSCKKDSEDLRSLMALASVTMNTCKSRIPTDSTFMLQSIQNEVVTMSLIYALPHEFIHVRATLGVHINLTNPASLHRRGQPTITKRTANQYWTQNVHAPPPIFQRTFTAKGTALPHHEGRVCGKCPRWK